MIIRRVVFEGKGECVVRDETEDPELGSTDVRVDASRSLISTGTEMSIYSRTHSGFADPNHSWVRYPFHPGYATAGVVVETGAEVGDVQSGDRVMHLRPHASKAVCNQSKLYRIPDKVSDEEALFARIGQISLTGVRAANIRLGEPALILGMGLVGQMAQMGTRLEGARPVIAVDLDDSRLELATKSGATHTINPAKEEMLSRVHEITGGEMVQTAIVVTGTADAVPAALSVIKRQGTVVLLGGVHGEIPLDLYATIHVKGIRLVGAHESTSPSSENYYSKWTQANNLKLMLALLSSGDVNVKHLITDRVSIDEVPALYDSAAKQPSGHLGMIIDWKK